MNNYYIQSPLNYIGGKYKLLPQILPLFPKQINTFVDLFCGGCNVGINVNAPKIIFNDNILYLIELYRVFYNKSINDILNHIESRIREYQLSLTNEQGYKLFRQLYNQQRNSLDLFILTAYSFNHQIRFNNSHEFNNPFGKDRSCFNPKMKYNLVAFLNKLHKKETTFTCNNFDNFDFSLLTNEDFVYCDPPYLITTGTYNDGKRGFTGWNEQEEMKLLSVLNKLNNKNIKFALSNVLIHKGKTNNILQKWITDNNFYASHLNMNYANSNYHTINRSNKSSDEVLITNYKPQIQQMLFE